MPMKPAPADAHEPQGDGGGGEMRSTLVSSGGAHHIEHEDGSMTEHPHIGHALMHMAGKHSDGVHHHIHHDGMGGGAMVHSNEHGQEGDSEEQDDCPMCGSEMEDKGSGGEEKDGKTSEGKDY